MKTCVVFGDKWHELNQLPELEHELFYEFLLLSPSYRLCHKLRLKEVRYQKSSLPPEWDLVKRTYDICGDIYTVGFEQWWTQTGHRIFFARSNSKVIIALDFSQPRQNLEKELSRIVNMGYQNAQDGLNRLSLLSSKIRVDTLVRRRNLVQCRAENEISGRPYNGYQLAFLANIASEHWGTTKRLGKLTSLSLTARTQLTELVSRQINEARLIAENAARGRFPSKSKITTPIDFDYDFIDGRFGVGRYPFSKAFTHQDRMNHPVFQHLQHLKERQQGAEHREQMKKHPQLDRLIREFNQLSRRKS